MTKLSNFQSHSFKISSSKEKGFSLIEIMVVVIILGILASIIIPKIMSRPDQARQVKAKQDVVAIENALNLYKLDNGFYPSTDQGLKALVEKPTNDPAPSNWRAYLKQLPMDPWNRPYQYLNPGTHGEIDIFTQGAEGQANGTGVNSTIGNWNASS